MLKIALLALMILFEATALLYLATHPPVSQVDVIYEHY